MNNMQTTDRRTSAAHLPDVSSHCFEVGRRILAAGGAALVGISLGNSYFSERNIAAMFEALVAHTGLVHVFVTDAIAHHTFQALGLEEADAKKKARLDGNNRRNRLERGLQAPIFSAGRASISQVDWNHEVLRNFAYAASYRSLKRLYMENSTFQHEIREVTRTVVLGHLNRTGGSAENVEKQVSLGVHFLLKELAFIDAAPEILGLEKVVYVYHRCWPILEKLLNGEFDGRPRSGVGFAIINPDIQPQILPQRPGDQASPLNETFSR